MKLAICTIQRNRAQWLDEWFNIHAHFGVDQFYFFAHKCTDNTDYKILELQKKFDIKAFSIADDIKRPQLAAYNWVYENFNHEFDWIAFIDGDEFLYPTELSNIKNVLQVYNYQKLSAIGIYWRCFGSSGHHKEPDGLITQNYVYRAPDDFFPNRHIKSIVRGREGKHFSVLTNSHFFGTIHGTFDENLRPISNGISSYNPSYKRLVINHYAVQSREFYLNFKKFSGSADAGENTIREEDWWKTYDRNEVLDKSLCDMIKI